MFAIIFSIILIIVGAVVGTILAKMKVAKLIDENEDRARYGKEPFPISNVKFVSWPLLIAIGLSLIIFIASCIAIVPTGYTGILTTFGRVENRTIASGANFIAPWQKVIKMDNRTQRVEINTSAFSSDIQQVDLRMSVNFCIDQNTAQTLYRTVGENYYETVMFPRIQENVKAVFSQYTAENLIAKRELLSEAIAENTRNDLSAYGITIVSFAVEDIDFTDAFTDAVEAKQVAAQRKLAAETEQAQKTMEEEQAAKRAVISAQADADKAIIAANADLEVVKVQAEAALYAGEKEAEMNKRISESLTAELIKYYWIKQWGGVLPETVLSNDGSYMVNLG